MRSFFLLLIPATLISCTGSISFDRFSELTKQHCDCLKALPADGSAGTCYSIIKVLNQEAHDIEAKIEALEKDDPGSAAQFQHEFDSLNNAYFNCQVANMKHLTGSPE